MAIERSCLNSLTGIQRVGADYFMMLTAQVVFVIVTAIGLTWSARLLGPEQYGVVVLFFAVTQCLFIIGVKWSFPAVIRFGREALVHSLGNGRVFWGWLPLFGLSVLGGSLILLLFSKDLVRLVGLGRNETGFFLWFFILLALTMATVQFLQMEGKMRTAAWIPVVSRVCFLGLLGVCIGWMHWPITSQTVILLSGIALLVQLLTSLPCLNRRALMRVQIPWELTQAMARYSAPLALGIAGAYLSDWADLYFLRLWRSHSDVGIYQLSYQAMLFVIGGLNGVSILAFPLLSAWRAEGREDRLHRYAVRLTPQIVLCWSLVILTIGLCQEPVLLSLFGPHYSRSAFLFSLLLIGAAFQGILYLYSPLLFVYDLTRQATGILVLMAGINVLGDFLLIPKLGSLGAAISTSASFALGAGYSLYLGNRRLGVRRFVGIVPPTLVACALLLMMGRGILVRGMIFGGIFLSLVWWARRCRIFTRDDASLLEQIQLPRQLRALVNLIYRGLCQERVLEQGTLAVPCKDRQSPVVS